MQQNWGKLQTGLVVWLDMAVEDIVARLSKDESEIAKRPLLQGGNAAEKLAAIYEERKPMYEQVCVKKLTKITYTVYAML
jgi:shikimate kinase